MDSISENRGTVGMEISGADSNQDEVEIMADHGTFGPAIHDVENMDEDDSDDIQVIASTTSNSSSLSSSLRNNDVYSVNFLHQRQLQLDNHSLAFVSNGSELLGANTAITSFNSSNGRMMSSDILKSSSADVVSTTVNSAIIYSSHNNNSISNSQQTRTPLTLAQNQLHPLSQHTLSLGAQQQHTTIVSQPSSCGKLFSHISTSGAVGAGQTGYTLLRSASGPSGKSCTGAGYATATSVVEKSYSANASSEVKSTLQRHILSKRFSANAAYAISGQHSKPSGGGAYPPNSNPSSKSPAASTFLSPPNSSLLQPPSNMSMRLPNSSCGTSNNSGGHLQMDSLDPAMLENSYSSKRLLTLSNSYGATATHPNVTVKPEQYKEPLRKTYSEPNLKMVRNKLKLHPPHDEVLLEHHDQMMDHGAALTGNSLISRQIGMYPPGLAHNIPSHRVIASCKSNPHDSIQNPHSGAGGGGNLGGGIGAGAFFRGGPLLHSATKRSSVDYLLPAPPSHKSKTMPLFPLHNTANQLQDFGHGSPVAAKLPATQNTLTTNFRSGGGDGSGSGSGGGGGSNFHSPLRIRLSDENSSCGSVSPQVLDANSEAQRQHQQQRPPQPPQSHALSGSPAASLFNQQGISKSSSYHGSILDLKGFHNPLLTSPPSSNIHHHQQQSSPNTTAANAAALSAIISAAAVQHNSSQTSAGVGGTATNVHQNPQTRQLINQPFFTANPQIDPTRDLNAAIAEAAGKFGITQSEMLAQLKNDASITGDPAMTALLIHQLQQQQQMSNTATAIPLYRHLSDSSIQSSFPPNSNQNQESNSHPPLRRIIGPAASTNNLPVPPMPALLSFAASNRNISQPGGVDGGNNSTSPILQSLSADSATLKDQQQNLFNRHLNSSILSAEYNQLFNFYYRQYSTAALLGAANVDQNSAVAAASLLMPAAFNPPKVVLEPPPPTPQFADMQLGNSQETSSTPTQVHSEREASSSASKAAGPGMQALQAKLQHRKQRKEALAAGIKQEPDAAMDASEAPLQRGELSDTGSSPSSDPDNSSTVFGVPTSASDFHSPSMRTAVPGACDMSSSISSDMSANLVGGPKKQPGVVLKKHQIFMMHSLQNSSGGAHDDKKSNVDSYSAHLASKRTGLGYNPVVLKHQCSCANADAHIESPLRVQYVWIKLLDLDIPKHCKVSLGREVQIQELEQVHNSKYVQAFSGSDQELAEELNSQLSALSCGGKGVDMDLVWNSHCSPGACVGAVGVVLELAEKVARNELSNAFALVRPPGHHAENSQPLGFSFFNNVAIAAKSLLAKNLARKIAIIDWDIHHGIGTEKVFESDPNVLYISVHRFDNGSFFPGTGSPTSAGTKEALGKTVNVGFSSHPDVPMADEDYMAAFRAVVVPLCQHFDPDIVLVSAGFDASRGHSRKLGGYIITPECFGWMTKQVLSVSNGKVLLCLEDGFDLNSLTDCVVACMYQLLRASTISSPTTSSTREHSGEGFAAGDVIGSSYSDQQSSFMQRLLHPPLVKKTSLEALPSPEAIQSIEATLAVHEAHWPQHLVHFARNQLHISQSQADSLSQSQSSSSKHQQQNPTTTSQQLFNATPTITAPAQMQQSKSPINQTSNRNNSATTAADERMHEHSMPMEQS